MNSIQRNEGRVGSAVLGATTSSMTKPPRSKTMTAPPKKPDEPERRLEEEEDLEVEDSLQEQEETLVALINHRKKELDNLRNRVAYYSKQLAHAEEVLSKDNSKLARLRKKIKAAEKDVPSLSVENGAIKMEEGSNLDPVRETDDEPSYLYTHPPKPKLIIPTGGLIFSKPSKNANTSLAKGGVVVKEENTSYDNGVLRVQDILGTKRKYEPKEQGKGDLVDDEKRSCARCLSDIGAVREQQHSVNRRRYELEELHKDAILVKEENSSGSSSDSEVTGYGTKRKYGTQEKYIEQCKDVLVADDKNSSRRSADTGTVWVQRGVAERKYEPQEHRRGVVLIKENSSGSSSDSKPMKMHDIGTKRNYERKEQHKDAVVVTREKSCGRSSDTGVIRGRDGTLKMRYEAKEHEDIIPLLCSTSSACTIGVESCNLLSGQHRRKLRTLSLCPADDMLFATSALDGVVNLWKIQGKGAGASLLSATECSSGANNRRWPEDVAWHPQGKSLFCAYSADEGSSQVSIVNLNKQGKNNENIFLEHKPHTKGIINGIVFMPWEEECFVTCGSDHSVIMWEGEGDDIGSWEPTALHRNMHSSTVMGVAGMAQRKVVLSVGSDKKIVGYDVTRSKVTYKHQLDSKCMSILPNPHDTNLFMVQTGKHESQLRLFDIREGGQKEVHTFGWKQQCSESQSALVRQVWSPDGLYISSGSSDPVIHIFDVRYNGNKPSQSISAHQKRVFKAVWHKNLPLLVSISSDANIALHKIHKP